MVIGRERKGRDGDEDIRLQPQRALDGLPPRKTNHPFQSIVTRGCLNLRAV